jgi:predicted nucleotidyltransferase
MVALGSNQEKLNRVLQDLRGSLQEIYGDRLIHLILFGSHARQEATDDSDIDVMVVLQDPVSPGDEIFRMSAVKTDLNLKHDVLISVIPISESDYQTRHTPLLNTIYQEGIAM